MSDKRRKRLMEEFEEAALELLIDEYAEADGERLLHEYEEAEKEGMVSDVPEDLDRKCKQIIQDSLAERNKRKHFRKAVRIFGKVAIFVFVFLGIVTTTVLSVDAVKVPVLNYFLRYNERYTAMSLNEENEEISGEVEDIQGCLSYCIPTQYILTHENISNHGTVKLLYEDENNHIISLTVANEPGQVFFDTENTEVQEKSINGDKAFFVEKDGFQLIWSSSQKGLSYVLYADALDQDVFWKIAYALAS